MIIRDSLTPRGRVEPSHKNSEYERLEQCSVIPVGAAGQWNSRPFSEKQIKALASAAKRQPPRPCPNCSRMFVPLRSDAVTCSDKCRQARFRGNQQ